MADLEIVRVVLLPSGKKLYPSPAPNSNNGGAFIWFFENQVGKKISLNMADFDGFVEIDTPLPITIGNRKRAVVVGTVIKALIGIDKKVTYSLFVDNTPIDPDIIIDGEGGLPGGLKKKRKGGKKKAAKKVADEKKA